MRKQKLIMLLAAVSLASPLFSKFNFMAKAETTERKLTLNAGNLMVGGSYGFNSYYKVKGTWTDLYDNATSGGWIVNKTPTSGSINMTYKANNEVYQPDRSGKCYGAVRVLENDANRIGSGSYPDATDGFIEITKSYSSGEVWSSISNPITLRYDATSKNRTLPVYNPNHGMIGKKSCANYSNATQAYAGFNSQYFGIGFYYGGYTCDLTDLNFYDDNYNSLGIQFDGDAPNDIEKGLYGKVGETIYINLAINSAIPIKGVFAVNENHEPVKLENMQNVGNGIYSFTMPNEDVIIDVLYQPIEVNLTLNGETYKTESINWTKEDVKTAFEKIEKELPNDNYILAYTYNNIDYKSYDVLYDEITKSDVPTSMNIDIKTVEIKMDDNASIRTIIGSNGLRFTARVKGDIDEFGMIIAKYSDISEIQDFTIETLKDYEGKIIKSSDKDFKYYMEDGYKVYSIVVTNIQTSNYSTEYCARAFVKKTYTDNTTKTIYSSFDERNISSPFEAGLITANDILDQIENDKEADIEMLELRRSYAMNYVDAVCNIDNSYHLIGNGRSYDVEKVDDGQIRIKPFSDDFNIDNIKILCINGIKISFTKTNDILKFSSSCIEPLQLHEYNGDEVDPYNFVIRGYLEAEDDATAISYLKSYSGKNYDMPTTELSWESVAGCSYVTSISETNDFKDAVEIKSNISSIKPGYFTPGKTYYYKVAAIKENKVLTQSDVDTLKIKDDLHVRQLEIPTTRNVRDEGGWTTTDGKTIKYDLLFRGASLNGHNGIGLNKTGIDMMNNILHMNSEIDLRTTGGDDMDTSGKAQYTNAFDENKPYLKAAFTQSCYIFPDFKQTSPQARSYDARTKESFTNIFKLLSDEKNYPVYFHCNAGADRTGTLGAIILGYLGVPEEELVKDFELTSFSVMGARWRSSVNSSGEFDPSGVFQDDTGNYIAYNKMIAYFHDHYDTSDKTLSSAIENYLVNELSISKTYLENMKAILLD